MLANRIPPDVASHALDAIGGTKHVVVITFFPETMAGGFPEGKGGVLLKDTDELAKVRARLGALRQKMEMVWHDAERMQ